MHTDEHRWGTRLALSVFICVHLWFQAGALGERLHELDRRLDAVRPEQRRQVHDGDTELFEARDEIEQLRHRACAAAGGDADRPWIATRRRGGLSDRRDTALEVGEAARDGHPAIADAADTPQRGDAVAADPDGRVGSLDRLGEENRVVDRKEPAAEGDTLVAPQPLEQDEILVRARAALVKRHTEEVELFA